MSKRKSLSKEIGNSIIVFLGTNCENSISGVLLKVTSRDIIVSAIDTKEAEIGMRHIVPWSSVFRIVVFDPEAYSVMSESDPEVLSKQEYEAPSWVNEVL